MCHLFEKAFIHSQSSWTTITEGFTQKYFISTDFCVFGKENESDECLQYYIPFTIILVLLQLCCKCYKTVKMSPKCQLHIHYTIVHSVHKHFSPVPNYNQRNHAFWWRKEMLTMSRSVTTTTTLSKMYLCISIVHNIHFFLLAHAKSVSKNCTKTAYDRWKIDAWWHNERPVKIFCVRVTLAT